jgi:hypothetical protein
MLLIAMLILALAQAWRKRTASEQKVFDVQEESSTRE